jgi:hypothetical protein
MTRLIETQERICIFLTEHGPTTKEQLRRRYYNSVTEFELNAILLVLTRSGLVREIKRNNNPIYEWVPNDSTSKPQ